MTPITRKANLNHHDIFKEQFFFSFSICTFAKLSTYLYPFPKELKGILIHQATDGFSRLGYLQRTTPSGLRQRRSHSIY